MKFSSFVLLWALAVAGMPTNAEDKSISNDTVNMKDFSITDDILLHGNNATSETTALGINCRGSVVCKFYKSNKLRRLRIILDIQEYINQLDDDQDIYNKQTMACYYPDKHLDPLVRDPYGGVCAFYQSLSGRVKGRDAKHHMQQIIDYGCNVCGSVPLDGKNVNKGELTVNYVFYPACDGKCI